MALFLNLYLGHLLGDFVFQPGRLVLAKRRGAPGLLIHTAIIAVCCTAVLAGELSELWQAILMIVVAHGLIEIVTILTYRETPTRGLFTFLLDQAMHVVSILAVVWVMDVFDVTTRTLTFGAAISTETLSWIVGFTAVGFLGSILVFETKNTVLRPANHKGILLQLDAARLVGIVERVAALGMALAIGWWALPLPFVPRAVFGQKHEPAARTALILEIITGMLLCAVAFALISAIKAVLG